MKIKYDINLMQYMNMFENLTRVKLKDCIEMPSGQLMFVVGDASDMGQAIGKGGSNIRLLEGKFKRKIKIVAFDPELRGFVKNLIYPLQARETRLEGDVLVIVGPDMKTKGLLIGRERQNLDAIKAVIQRYFPIKDIKVE